MKKTLALVLILAMSMMAFIPALAEGEKITLYAKASDTSLELYDEYIANAEAATGLEIEVLTMPSNTTDRLAKATMVLSSGDTSIDILTLDDEMLMQFKETGFLAPLQDEVYTEEVLSQFPQDYMKDLTMDAEGNIYSVPNYLNLMAMWVNQEMLDKAGLESLNTKEDFLTFLKANSDGETFGFGGAWEKTYVYNDLANFVSLFDGDYYDWSNENSRAAVEFMKSMVTDGYTDIAQLADQYDQLLQKFLDGKIGCMFLWSDWTHKIVDSGKYGADKLHMTQMPTFNADGAFVCSWHYVLNNASENKEAAYKFLQWAASPEGELEWLRVSGNAPARTDVLNTEGLDFIGLSDIQGYLSHPLKSRPLAPQSMEFISAMGSLFQQYVTDEIDLDTFCQRAQVEVDTYIIR